ncbi:MAG TPA: decarboxylating 6-phosphogluconate dehydrogenase [Casimicrobium huifangae]|jgi:6-phosphogluconate dehydrogenase|uniref:phosphogluconate dehydrogenase (NAD(+)-dependent, decarboxylating) n=1 Tax=Casimicrobium huifangae TaxID=2591109 RepID=UPI0012EC2043|nr:decarboxylating 6-phosphogluconate dehydrogenase [Casimicrobium huifangae]HOB00792.1 decarboxylating 6-phosphogluconate dehydrogenase [Casimicrobium huifangae]HQA33559.1 decarboxylating 6-phosphogluconate dehydrogenase [Casimicrobium huifangae]HQD63884.1 decarboxylating 6-phosphogluconate dehydrogenase [Casimicrobium huifangae]
MQVVLIGLGRMGANMARRWARGGVNVVAFDQSEEARAAATEARVRPAGSIAEALAAGAAATPRIVWLMLPAGEVTEATIAALLPQLAKGDLLVDGGNANYKDTLRRAGKANALGIDYADVGVSGGVWGLANGYCVMAGASAADYQRLKPLLEVLAPSPTQGIVHAGAVGAGHYAKMVHNGIEYGMMQALAEGFALMEAKKDFAMPVAEIAEAWRDGSVVRSWLLDLTAAALRKPDEIAAIAPYVSDSGEGRWAVEAMVELGVPAPVTALALTTRFATQGRGDYAAKLLAQMRAGFGGHAVKKAD